MRTASSPQRPAVTLLLLGIMAAFIVALGFAVQQAVNAPGSGPTPSPATGAWPPSCKDLRFGPTLAAQPGSQGLKTFSAPPPMQIKVEKKYRAVIRTAKGTIELCLDPKLAPQTVNNFVFLARNKFYDGLKFHRVEPDFVIQGGDPKGDGTGGPGYSIADEPVRGEYTDGAIAMANAGPNSTGSQFFIDIDDNRPKLQKLYNLFGVVSAGLDVAKKITVGDVIRTVTVQEQEPPRSPSPSP